jgi:hypothetical protein
MKNENICMNQCSYPFKILTDSITVMKISMGITPLDINSKSYFIIHCNLEPITAESQDCEVSTTSVQLSYVPMVILVDLRKFL